MKKNWNRSRSCEGGESLSWIVLLLCRPVSVRMLLMDRSVRVGWFARSQNGGPEQIRFPCDGWAWLETRGWSSDLVDCMHVSWGDAASQREQCPRHTSSLSLIQRRLL